MTMTQQLKKSKNEITSDDYFTVRSSYDDDINKQKEAAGNDGVTHYYLEKAADILRKLSMKIADNEEARLEILRIMFYLEDNSLMEVAKEWFESNLESRPNFFSKIYNVHDFTEEDELAAKEEEKKQFQQSEEIERQQQEESQLLSMEEVEKSLAIHIDRLRTARQEQVKETLAILTQKVLNSDFVQEADVVVALAENKLLKKMLIGIFEKLGVEIQSTVIDYVNTQVNSQRLKFVGNSVSYSMENFNNGFVGAIAKITGYQLSTEQNRDNVAKLTTMELDRKNKEASIANNLNQLTSLKQEVELLKAKPSIDTMKVKFCRIAWNDENGKRYYLGTSADLDEANDEGMFRVASLIKTRKALESLAFEDAELAKAQVQRAIKHYKNINREQLISLVHLKEAYIVTTLEHVDRKTLRQAKVNIS